MNLLQSTDSTAHTIMDTTTSMSMVSTADMDVETTMNAMNGTMEMVTGNFSGPMLPPDSGPNVFYIVVTVVVGIGMIGIGATVHYKILLHYLKKPKAYILGILLQLLIMPLLSWALTKIFNMSFGEALGVFIQGCSPGGTTSNLVIYWMGGIVDLSVAMTITTTLLSMGTIPLWLLIYEAGEPNSQNFAVPYDQLAIALATLVVPIIIGMVIRVRLEKYASLISKIIITIASIGVLVILIVRAVLSPIPWIVTWKQAVVAALLPLIAFAFGYLVTLIPFLKLTSRLRTTVAVETALQNAQIASAVIELTVGNQILLFIQVVLFPLFYYIFQVGYSVLFIIFYNLAKRKGWIVEDEEDAGVDLLKSKKKTDNLDMKKKEAEKSAPNDGKENPAFENP